MTERVIWKFVLDPWRSKVSMPKGARLIHVHEQAGNVCVWAECDPAAPEGERRLIVVGTGHQVPRGEWTYVGTAHIVEALALLVLHVYDGGEA